MLKRVDHPLKEAVQTDYRGRSSILCFYHRIFPASHDSGVHSCPLIPYISGAIVEPLLGGMIIQLLRQLFLASFF